MDACDNGLLFAKHRDGTWRRVVTAHGRRSAGWQAGIDLFGRSPEGVEDGWCRIWPSQPRLTSFVVDTPTWDAARGIWTAVARFGPDLAWGLAPLTYEVRRVLPTAGTWMSSASAAIPVDGGVNATFQWEGRVRDARGRLSGVLADDETFGAALTPPVPGSCTLTPLVGGTSLRYDWAAVVNATSYEVRLNGGGWQNVGNTLTWTWNGLASSTQFTAEVRAVSAGGTGLACSSTASTNRPPPPQVGVPVVTSPVDDFAGFTFAWGAVAHATVYDVEVYDEWGNLHVAQATGDLSWRFGAAWQTRWQVRVRARNEQGNGAWSGFLRWRVGRPQQVCDRQVQGTRPWASQVGAPPGQPGAIILFRNNIVGVDVPPNVVIHSMTPHLAANGAFSQINSPTRASTFIVAGQFGFPTGQQNLPWFQTFSFQQAVPGIAGMVLHGDGWGTNVGSASTLQGLIRVDGTETFWFTEQYVCVAQENGSFW